MSLNERIINIFREGSTISEYIYSNGKAGNGESPRSPALRLGTWWKNKLVNEYQFGYGINNLSITDIYSTKGVIMFSLTLKNACTRTTSWILFRMYTTCILPIQHRECHIVLRVPDKTHWPMKMLRKHLTLPSEKHVEYANGNFSEHH